MSRCLRCLVSGRVQGVWYRASTQQEARALGIIGHARNLPDGRVEVLACGEEGALEALRRYLWRGPPAAQVDAVECTDEAASPPPRFTTR